MNSVDQNIVTKDIYESLEAQLENEMKLYQKTKSVNMDDIFWLYYQSEIQIIFSIYK